MARKSRVGLTYFPLDVDFHDDPKIELITAEFGAKGECIAVRLMCKIYRSGYFLEYTDDEGLLIAKRVGCEGALVTEVVKGLVRRSFFDKGVFDQFKILTSRGIQKRFIEACERRQKVIMLHKYLLLQHDVDIIPKNVTVIDDNVHIGTQKRREEKREEERRGEDTPTSPSEGVNREKKIDQAPAKEAPPLPPPPPLYEMPVEQCEVYYLSEHYIRAREQICMGRYVDMPTLDDWVRAFTAECVGQGRLSKSVADYASHFSRWIKFKDMSANPKNLIHETKEGNGQQTNKNGGNKNSVGAKELNADYKANLLRRMGGNSG